MPARTPRPNRDALNDALDTYRDTMRQVIMDSCPRAQLEASLDRLKNQHDSDTGRRGNPQSSNKPSKPIRDRIDTNNIENIITEFWDTGLYKWFDGCTQKRLCSQLGQIRNARNEAAHPPEGDLKEWFVKDALHTIFHVVQLIKDDVAAAKDVNHVLERWQDGGYHGIGQLTPINDIRLAAGATVSWDLSEHFKVPGGRELVYNISASNENIAQAHIDQSKLTVRGKRRGTTIVKIWAIPPSAISMCMEFSVTVPNQPPRQISPFYDVTISLDAHMSMGLAYAFFDPDEESLRFAATTSDCSVVATQIEDSTLVLTGKSQGVVSIVVTASDPAGASAEAKFDVFVTGSSSRLSTLFQNHSLATNANVDLDLLEYFNPRHVDAVKFVAESSHKGVAYVEINGSMLRVTGIGRGTAHVNVSALLPTQQYLTYTFTVSVPNQPPLQVRPFYPIEVQIEEHITYYLSEYFNDPDEDILTYTASSSNDNIVFVHVEGSKLTVKGVERGEAMVNVTATDPDGASVTDGIRARVPNRGPYASTSIDSCSVDVGHRIELALSHYFTDPDGDALHFAVHLDDDSVARARIDGAMLTIEGSKVGDVGVTVVATDTYGAYTGDRFVVHVTRPPGFLKQIWRRIR